MRQNTHGEGKERYCLSAEAIERCDSETATGHTGMCLCTIDEEWDTACSGTQSPNRNIMM